MEIAKAAKRAVVLGCVIIRFKCLSDDLAVGFLQQNFDAAFGFFELLLTFAGKLDAFFEEFHGLVEGQVGAFEALHDFLEAGEGFLEIAFLGGLGGGRGSFVRYGTHSSSMRGDRALKTLGAVALGPDGFYRDGIVAAMAQWRLRNLENLSPARRASQLNTGLRFSPFSRASC